MPETSVQVAVTAPQVAAFARLRDHLEQTGAIAAASASAVHEPRSITYSLRLRDDTTQTTTIELTPFGTECLLTMSVRLDNRDPRAATGWLPPQQLARQHKTLAEIFARIANGTT